MLARSLARSLRVSPMSYRAELRVQPLQARAMLQIHYACECVRELSLAER